MPSLDEIGGITINVLSDPDEHCLPVGDLAGYDDIRGALDLALQSKRTHPDEEYHINFVRDKWRVSRVVKK